MWRSSPEADVSHANKKTPQRRATWGVEGRLALGFGGELAAFGLREAGVLPLVLDLAQMALYSVACGVAPPGLVQSFLAAIASTICLQVIGSPAPASTCAAASMALSLSRFLAGVFFAVFVAVAFLAVVLRAAVFLAVVFFAVLVVIVRVLIFVFDG